AFGAIEMLDKGQEPAFVEKLVVFLCTLVFESDFDAAIKKRQFAQTLRQNIVAEIAGLKDCRIGLEGYPGAALFRLADLFQRFLRVAALVTLLINLAVAFDFDF